MQLISKALAAATPVAPITNVQQIVDLMCSVFAWMFYGLIALSLIMIVLAGFNYVTAGDNSEKVSKATKMILYAAIGVGVALLARAIPLIVSNFLGAGSAGVAACSQ
jgi:hypothetical protein